MKFEVENATGEREYGLSNFSQTNTGASRDAAHNHTPKIFTADSIDWKVLGLMTIRKRPPKENDSTEP